MVRGLFTAALAVLALAGCASTVAKILPFGEPVTKERCAAFSMLEFGRRDGREARRPGERFESWQQDCRAFGVKFDRDEYDRGYREGLTEYCSCEKGFAVGVKGGFAELRGQYFMCESAEYAHFHRGVVLGRGFEKDEALVRRVTPVKTEYDDAGIGARAAAQCAALPESQAKIKEARLHIALKVDARRKVSGPSVLAHLEYTNNTAETLRFVNWVLGRGGEPSNDFFKVTRDGKELPYQGKMAKRAAPAADDFVVLKPGESLQDSVDLSRAYAWSLGPGRYELHLETGAQEPGTSRVLRSEDASFSF